MTLSPSPADPDPTFRQQMKAHLERLARFALIDDVPSPWDLIARPLIAPAALPDRPEAKE